MTMNAVLAGDSAVIALDVVRVTAADAVARERGHAWAACFILWMWRAPRALCPRTLRNLHWPVARCSTVEVGAFGRACWLSRALAGRCLLCVRAVSG